MPILGSKSATPDLGPDPGSPPEPVRKSRRWRPQLRALHRDLGYLAVGLTVVYAVSGLAVNHIADWDPNFANYERVLPLKAALDGESEDAALAAQVTGELAIVEPIVDVYRVSPEELQVFFESRTLHVDIPRAEVREEGQRPRLLLRLANWLHLNRGKQAWTVIADAYAVGLLLLATTGIFMIPGRRGLRGRGGLLILAGAAVPILYVTLSGGP